MELIKGGRIQYLDVAKFLGIFAIYIGHMGEAAVGHAYNFVFAYHVQLFFFISGCTEHLSQQKSFPVFFKDKLKNLFFPWLFFAIAALLFNALHLNAELTEVTKSLPIIFAGCPRNEYLAAGLWFLTCMFVLNVMFYFLKKLKKTWIIFAVSVSLWVCYLLWGNDILLNTRDYWNFKGAIYYLIFYALGYVLFKPLDALLNSKWLLPAAIVPVIYTFYRFFGKDLLDLPTPSILSIYGLLTVKTLLMILCNLFIAYLLRNVKLFQNLGRDSLYLCGNEYITTTLFFIILAIISPSSGMVSPAGAFLCTFLMLALTSKYIVPTERRILAACVERFGTTFHFTKKGKNLPVAEK